MKLKNKNMFNYYLIYQLIPYNVQSSKGSPIIWNSIGKNGREFT